MARYKFLKAPKGYKKIFFKMGIFFNNNKKYIPFVCVPVGISLLIVVFYPLVSYKLLVFNRSREGIISPISNHAMAEARGLINPVVNGVFTEAKRADLGEENEINYDLVNNWFPSAPKLPEKEREVDEYLLSIPKLGIENARVKFGGDSLKKNLVHYPGTALPGEFGNALIFGHSVLPAFYNPKDYKTIFSTIPTLEKGDTIHVLYDGVEYIYEVYEYVEVKPEEIKVLEQRFDRRIMSLITCVPPGTYLRRGIVRARLVQI